MRFQILKLKKGHSTKAERRFMELCKDLRKPFAYKVRVGKYETDFIVGKLAIEINGHKQNVSKNIALLKAGYTPFNLDNRDINSSLKNWLKKI